MIKSVEVIGCGGAFDTEMTNSSFLIHLSNKSILFDCGYNVFSKLKKLEEERPDIIRDISHIIISHLDDDHMGSLKSFLYYRYFNHGMTTTVVGRERTLTYVNGINKKMQGFKFVEAEICRCSTVYSEATNTFDGIKDVNFRFISGVHHVDTDGVVIYDSEKIVLISGDTKSTSKFSNAIIDISNSMKVGHGTNALIFHDYSPYNAPSRNVHATDNCISSEYPKWFKNEMIKYHYSFCKIEDNIYTFSPEKKKWVINI